MKHRKLITLLGSISLVLVVAATSLMTACTSQESQLNKDWPEAQVWTGVPAGSTSTVMAISLAQLVTNELGTRISVQPTVSATEALMRLVDGRSDLCMTTTFDLYNAYRGLDAFEGKETGMVRALVCQYVTLSHIVGKEGIENFDDIRGKRFMIEAPAAKAHNILTKACLDAYGMTYEDFISMPRLSAGEQIAAMKDGTTDVVTFPGHPPAPYFSQMATDIDVNFISIDEGKAKAICEEFPFYTYKVIPAGTYKGQDQDVMSVGFTMVLAVREDFPEDLAYEIVSILFSNIEELYDVHPVYKELDLDIGTKYRGGPYHSGVVEYYEEMGVWTSELEAMQEKTLAEFGQ